MTDLRTLDGRPAGPDHGHTGWPVDQVDVLDRARRGLPAYWPTDPTSVDQAPYRRFATERGANSA